MAETVFDIYSYLIGSFFFSAPEFQLQISDFPAW